MAKKLIKDLLKYIPSYVIPGIVMIFAIPIYTRIFSPQEYGTYVLINTTVIILSTIGSVWISSSSLRFYPVYKKRKNLPQFLSTIFKLSMISIFLITFIVSLSLLFARNILPVEIYGPAWIGVLILILNSFSLIMLDIIRAKRLVVWYSSFRVWKSVVEFSLGILLAVFYHLGISGLLWGTFLALLLAIPVLLKKSFGKIYLHYSLNSHLAKNMLKYGGPIVVVNLASRLLSLADRFIINIFHGSKDVGIYSANYTISEQSIFMISALFLIASPPIGFNIWENSGKEAARDYLKTVTRYYIIIGLPVAIGMAILARPIAQILISESYLPGCKIIPLISLGAFFVGITHRFSDVLTYYKRTDIIMYCITGSLVINLLLNLLLVPRYSFWGAAIATFIAYLVDLTARIILSRRMLVWQFPFKTMKNVTIASTVMGVSSVILNHIISFKTIVKLIITIPLGISLYIISLIILNEFTAEEKLKLHKLFSVFFRIREK